MATKKTKKAAKPKTIMGHYPAVLDELRLLPALLSELAGARNDFAHLVTRFTTEMATVKAVINGTREVVTPGEKLLHESLLGMRKDLGEVAPLGLSFILDELKAMRQEQTASANLLRQELIASSKAMEAVFTAMVAATAAKPARAPRAPKEEKPAGEAAGEAAGAALSAPAQPVSAAATTAPAAAAASAAAPASPSAAATTAQPAPAPAAPSAGSSAGEPADPEQVKTAFLRLVQAKNRETALALLAKYGAKTVAGVPAAQLGAFMAECVQKAAAA